MVPKAHAHQFESFVAEAKAGRPAPVYVIIGEAPVCRPLVDQLVELLLPQGSRAFNLTVLSGESGQGGRVLEALETRGFFPGRRVVVLRDPLGPAEVQGEATLDSVIKGWLARGADTGLAVLIIEASQIDRRGRLYGLLKKEARVLDLSARGGSPKDQAVLARQAVENWVEEAGKSIEASAVELLLAEVGADDLFALQKEVEKLVTQAGEHGRITTADVTRLVVRHRQEELYRLTEAIGNGDTVAALTSLRRLLEQGIHPLAVLQTIANYLRRLVLVKTALEEGGVSVPRAFPVFQREVLPDLKKAWGEVVPDAVKSTPPYGLYRLCQQTRRFDLERLLRILGGLYQLDLTLKGGATSPHLALERLVMQLTGGNERNS